MGQLMEKLEPGNEKDLLEQALRALAPLIDVLNYAQSDGASSVQVFKNYCSAISKLEMLGFDTLAAVSKERLPQIKNDLVQLHYVVSEGEEFVNEQAKCRVVKWLNTLKSSLGDKLESYLIRRTFIENACPKELKDFVSVMVGTFATSEAAVERCFYKHKLQHCKLRERMNDELVNDILFIKYNGKHVEPEGGDADGDEDFEPIDTELFD